MAKYGRSKTVKFINPYNFISVGQQGNRKKGNTDQKKLTGKLTCRLYTKTPLAILDTNKKHVDGKKHPSYPFFKIEEKPMIPGSSIRGMLRSYYETLTDSCFVTLSENESLTVRTPVNQPFSPGVLMKNQEGNWSLYKAVRGSLKVVKADCIVDLCEKERVIKKDGVTYQNGDFVKAKFNSVPKQNRKGKNVTVTYGELLGKADDRSNYVLYVGEHIGNKKNESIFQIKEKEKVDPELLEKAFNGLKNTVAYYQDPAINRNLGKGPKDHSGYANFKTAEKKGVIPLWYKREGGKLYLSMACIGRKAFNNTVGDLVGKNRTPCTNRDALCPACRLFGTARGDAFGSRIRVADAWGEKVTLTKNKVDLKELGSPRVGYLQFYAKNGKTYDAEDANILGRKYYWHIPEAAEKSTIYEETDKEKNTERNSSCELAMPGSEFSFDVYYDGITEEQLEELIWVISLGDNRKDSSHCQKLGHGKPIGLGSVKIVVESNTRRIFDETGYQNVTEKLGSVQQDMPSGIQTSIWEQMRVISNFEFMRGMEVRYPYISDEDDLAEGNKLKENVQANHVWFSENKAGRKGGPAPLLLKPLASVSKHNCKNGEFALPVYKFTEIMFEDYEKNSNQGNSHHNEKKYEKGRFVVGNVYSFKVTGYKDNKDGQEFYLQLKDESERVARIPYYKVKQGKDATCVKIGSIVKLECLGFDEGKYPKWKVCKG